MSHCELAYSSYLEELARVKPRGICFVCGDVFDMKSLTKASESDDVLICFACEECFDEIGS